MRRFWRILVLAAAVVTGADAGAQAGYGGGQAANPAGYGGNLAMMVVQTVASPDFRGMTLAEAQAANVVVSTKAGLAQRPIFAKLNTTGPIDGVVTAQTPVAGTKVYPGQVTATLTLMAVHITVPMLRGMNVVDARSRLSQGSLILGQVSGDARLKIANQTPEAGVTVPPLTVVDVVMAAPVGVVGATGVGDVPPDVEVTVPKVLMLSEASAAAKLLAAGLGRPIMVGPASGVVVRQTPVAGTMAVKGSHVKVVMGTQKNDIIIPQPKANPWGWYAAGGVVLLGAVGAFVAATKTPTPPAPHPNPTLMPAVAATIVMQSNVASRKVVMKADPTVRWSIQLRDKPALGVTAVSGGGEIKGERKG